MVSLFRLKGRALQIDNALIMMLTFFTGFLLISAAGLLPSVYGRLIEPIIPFADEKTSLYVRFAVSLVILGASFGLYSSVRLGTKRYLFKKAVKKKPTSRDIFFYFRPKKFFSSFFYSVKIFFLKLFLLFFFLPPTVCLITVDRFSRQGVSALVCLSLFVTALCLLLNGAVFYSLFSSSFFLCDYYFISGKYLSFRHLVSCSQKNMRGKNTLLTRLKLSFGGWFLFSVLVFPVPYVWGYYNQSLAVAAAEFMD